MDRICGAALRCRALNLMVDGGWSEPEAVSAARFGRRRQRQVMPLTGHLRHLSNKLLELRKRAKAQPGLQIRLKLSVSSDDQRAGAFGLSNSSIAHPNLGHCPQIGDKIKIDIKTRIYRAKIDLGASRKRSSQRTQRWREMDSNFRFRAKGATDLSFRFCLCPCLHRSLVRC